MIKNQAFDVLLVKDKHQVTLSEHIREIFDVKTGDFLLVKASQDNLIVRKLRTIDQLNLEEVFLELTDVIDQYLHEPDEMDGSSLIFSPNKVFLSTEGKKREVHGISPDKMMMDSILDRLSEKDYKQSTLIEYRSGMYSIRYLSSEHAFDTIVTITRESSLVKKLLKIHHVEPYLKKLSERNQTIIRMRFAWGEYKTPLKVEQIALQIGLAESTVYKIIRDFESRTAAAEIRKMIGSV
ncbi:hypothetical protein [Paenibacillus sp. FSL H8-0034]|uniref:hypothetical protein n=1 Tax=Paenibacillus sp. FSL H8-0034 TaxID=2954671 RepID=UPI0030FA83C6